MIGPSFQGVNKLFVLSFESIADNIMHKIFSSNQRNKILECCDRWKKLFWLADKNDVRTYDRIQKIATVKEDHYTTGCSQNYNYCKNYY